MNLVPVLNGAAIVLALAASTAVAWWPSARSPSHALVDPSSAASSRAVAPELVDHAGVVVPRRDYRRILSGSTVVDALLLEMAEPDRVIAFTAYGARSKTHGYRYGGKPALVRLDDVEAILTARPDLVLVNGTGDRRVVARLREAGLVVYDLGEMRGLATLVPDIHEVAELLGHPERGDRMASAITDAMRTLSARLPEGARRRGMYLSVYGGRVFGGAAGTSYHDVLSAAGVVDAAAGFRDWPEYTAEQIVAVDPDVVVTNAGMRARICEHAGLSSLRACARDRGVVEVDDDVLGDPGPAMVEAARAVRDGVYGTDDAMTKGRAP